MKILIFNSNFSKKNMMGWSSFVNSFKNFNLSILTETSNSKKIFNNQFKDIKCYSLNEDLNFKNFSDKNIIKIHNKYKDTRIFIERLSLYSSPESLLTNNPSNYVKNVSLYIYHLENFLEKNKIDLILMCIVESYQSYVYSLLENVAKKNNTKLLIFQHPLLRGFVYTNQLRYSDKIYDDFNDLKLTEDKKRKVVKAITSYKKYIESDIHHKYLYRKKSFLNNLKFFFKNRINFYINNIENYNDLYVDAEYIKKNNEKYSILLLNKINNYRNYKFSPFYSLPENLIRSISLSLPLDHKLLIKLHPHDTSGNIYIINEVIKHHNVKLLNTKASLAKVLPIAQIVFSQSTSSSIEALMYYKHLIMFGNNLQFFGTKFDIVHRVTNLENLPRLIEKLLISEVDTNNINKFFYSFFSNSFSRDLSDDNQWDKFELHTDIKENYIKAANSIKKFMENI